MAVVTIEYDHLNRKLFFRPLQRVIRGRWVRHRCGDRRVRSAFELPDEIPSQQIGVDPVSKTGFIIEPIHSQPKIVAQLAPYNYKFEPPRSEFPGIDPAEWLHHMKKLVDLGHATLVAGVLPEKVSYREPLNPFNPEARGPARLEQIFRSDPATAAAYMDWPAEKQRRWEALVGV